MWRARRGEVLLLVGVGLPFPTPTRRGKEGGEGEGKGGRRPHPLSNSDWQGGARHHLTGPLSSPLRPMWPITSPGGGGGAVPVTSQYSGILPISPGTIPMSKHRLPIYRSLHLDHFKTPRHAVIKSGTPNYLWYIKTHKLVIPIVTER